MYMCYTAIIIDSSPTHPTRTETDGGGYNWMAPSLQSQDASFSIGTSTPSTADSALFTMRPPSGRPFRPVGDSFGKKRLGNKDPQATGTVCGLLIDMHICTVKLALICSS